MQTGIDRKVAAMGLGLALAAACGGLGLERAVASPRGDLPVADFFVSPQGKDAWPGKRAEPGEDDGPFATVARARNAIRQLLITQKKPRALRVVLRGGTYYLDSPLEFGPEDSGTPQAPVIYSVAAGAKLVLSGGRRLGNGQRGEVNGRKAWMVDLPEVKAGPEIRKESDYHA